MTLGVMEPILPGACSHFLSHENMVVARHSETVRS